MLGRTGRVRQRGSYDRMVRSKRDFNEKLDYLGRNPARAGSVERREDYPYAWYRLRDGGQ